MVSQRMVVAMRSSRRAEGQNPNLSTLSERL